MSVLAVGSVAFDSVETKWGRVDDVLGGSLSYFVAAAGLFSKIYPVCVVGEDFPSPQETWGNSRKIDLSHFKVVKGKTFRWKGKYHEDMDLRETLLTDLGVFASFNPVIKPSVRNIPYVFLGNISPSLQLQILSQLGGKNFIVMDTMNYWIERNYSDVLEVVKNIDLLMINNEELLQLTKTNDERAALDKFFSFGAKYIVLKKGKIGASLHSKDRSTSVGVYEVEKVIDTTGAGDSFAGGYLGYISERDEVSWQDLEKALCYGSAAASFAIESFSFISLKKATREDIEVRVKITCG